MKRPMIAVSALALVGANAPHPPATHTPATHTPAAHTPSAPALPPPYIAPPTDLSQPSPFESHQSAQLPGFAAVLAERPLITGPEGWAAMPRERAWEAIALSQPESRQEARWTYALSLLAPAASGFLDDLGGLAADALGVLDVMALDDPDMLLVPSFRLARGLALVRVGRGAEAIIMLTDPMLIANPEACLWRMMAQAHGGHHALALSEVGCAVKAINRRSVKQARPFILSAARAAIANTQAGRALGWLGQLKDIDPAANLLRGQAYLLLGKQDEGKLRLERTALSGSPPERIEAQLALVEAQVAHGDIKPRDALKSLDRIRFVWRGNGIEERALRLGYRLAEGLHDRAATLSYSATLLRYYETGAEAAPLLASAQAQLMGALAQSSQMKLGDAVGLFWDYRDLAPTGTGGDALLHMLARRLADAKLYERAADLLSYQMNARARDIEKGPVSEQVSRLYILAGKPAHAIEALRMSDQPAYPQAMLDARHRMEAVALYQLGQVGQALAILDDMPDMAALRGEMLWRRRDWQGLVARLGSSGPVGRSLSPAAQAVILRNAIALNMLGKETELVRLRARYGAAFAASSSAAAFSLLTGPIEEMTGTSIARAMAAIPSVSVAGEYEAMLDAKPNLGPSRRAKGN